MMLAKDPGLSPAFFWDRDHGLVGFVASVVAASEEELQIRVSSTNEVNEATAAGTCGDFGASPIAPGWPQVYTYYLVENDQDRSVGGHVRQVHSLFGRDGRSYRKCDFSRSRALVDLMNHWLFEDPFNSF
jgi:hypothetical protein